MKVGVFLGVGLETRTTHGKKFEEEACRFKSFLLKGVCPHLRSEYSDSEDLPSLEHIRGSDYGGGIGGIFYSLYGGIPSYNTYNSRGDVVAQTDENATVTWEAAYEAFGNRTAEVGENMTRHRANTKDEDPTGFLNEGYRYRDLETGVFLTRDPAGFIDGPNVYTYVRQNPWTMFDPLGLAGYFFDGTGNDKDTTDAKAAKPTHVAAIHDAYDGNKVYEHGVGTRTDKMLGGLGGRGARERLDDAFSQFEYHYKSGDTEIDIFGFSRGAAMAREFANMINDKYPQAKIRFLGIFDTVAQIGSPDPFNINPGIRLDIPENVEFTVHAVAKNEYRALFPLTSIVKGNKGVFENNTDYQTSSSPRFVERPFAGAHSDVGGSYKDGGNRAALEFMMRAAGMRGVPLDRGQWSNAQRKFFSTYPSQWHDSRMSKTGAPDLWGFEPDDRRVFEGNLVDPYKK